MYNVRFGVLPPLDATQFSKGGRGFGEAAVTAFQNLRGEPAYINGLAVGVRYRYPVRFRMS
jgi:protein TonB